MYFKFQRIFWTFILLLSITLSIVCLYQNIFDFKNATVITYIDSMTVPLSEIFFPSVVVCNMNQVRLSFYEEQLNISREDINLEEWDTHQRCEDMFIFRHFHP